MDDSFSFSSNKYRQAWPVTISLAMTLAIIVFCVTNPDFEGDQMPCWATGNGTAYFVPLPGPDYKVPEEFVHNITSRFFSCLVASAVLCFMIGVSQILVLLEYDRA